MNQEIKKIDLVIAVIFALILGYPFLSRTAQEIKGRGFFSANSPAENAVQKNGAFAGIELLAKSAIVWDAKEDRVIFAKNENSQLPLASLAKIMTALVALDSGEPEAVVSREAVREEGDSGLLVGEKWKLEDLARLTLVASANDGAYSLASAWIKSKSAETATTSGKSAFVYAMNRKAADLKLSETYFLNETGLDVSSELSGGYGSASDIARLFYHTVISYPAVFETTGSREVSVTSLGNRTHTVRNTNEGVEGIPGIVASKTGFTNIAGGNLVIMINAGLNHPIVIAVLGSTGEGRFADAENLAAAAVSAIGNE